MNCCTFHLFWFSREKKFNKNVLGVEPWVAYHQHLLLHHLFTCQIFNTFNFAVFMFRNVHSTSLVLQHIIELSIYSLYRKKLSKSALACVLWKLYKHVFRCLSKQLFKHVFRSKVACVQSELINTFFEGREWGRDRGSFKYVHYVVLYVDGWKEG